MTRSIILIQLILLPMLLCAGSLTLTLDTGFSPADAELPSGWGSLTAPGQYRLPVLPVNIIIPPNATDVQFTFQFTGLSNQTGPAPETNPPFTDGERVLSDPAASPEVPQLLFRGTGRWGDVASANFSVLPAVWTSSGWQIYSSVQIDLSWTDDPSPKANHIPPVLSAMEKDASPYYQSFYANPQDLAKYYTHSSAKLYDILLVTTSQLYPYLEPLTLYHQSLGLTTGFADISTILTTSPGATPGEKLRNYLAGQYYANPYSYVLLVGDYDTVPVMYLTPEPNGYETVASDFFYGDLSSVVDTDSDGRLGEYSALDGVQDYLCDFTPEAYVGRISTNNASQLSQIILRTVAYDQSDAPWKQKALLPAAYLNYGGEPETIYLQTDGATFMEYAKATALSGYDCTTMYEQLGYVPSYPSTFPLDYNGLRNLLDTESYGILSWSAHGSSGSSSRKVWMNDDNQNNLPDSWEMNWMNMVDGQSFNYLENQNGLILFAASCYNGMIDGDQACLAEYALQKKAVNVCASTRTGWYKIGWKNPGWGGLTSYNYHWLENIARNQMSVGAAHAYTNLTHTQYYLFGDPVDAGGIIYPELQNVYTNLLFGDPVVGHRATQAAPLGEILVFEPVDTDGLPIVDALNATGRFNVVYTDKLIPDYDYINQFEAVFCLFGWGDTAYILNSGSLEYNLLNSYLQAGGNIYLEGDVAWDPQDTFWGKFSTHAPLDYMATIEGLQASLEGVLYTWEYDQTADTSTQILLPYCDGGEILFMTHNDTAPDQSVGVFSDCSDNWKTVASSFALAEVLPGDNSLADMLSIILDRFGIIDFVPVSNDDPQVPAILVAGNRPNPFNASTSLRFELARDAEVTLVIYNLRGQKVRTLASGRLGKGTHELVWDGLDAHGSAAGPGIYIWNMKGGNSLQTGKMLKLPE
jgi:hypothetical protein